MEDNLELISNCLNGSVGSEDNIASQFQSIYDIVRGYIQVKQQFLETDENVKKRLKTEALTCEDQSQDIINHVSTVKYRIEEYLKKQEIKEEINENTDFIMNHNDDTNRNDGANVKRQRDDLDEVIVTEMVVEDGSYMRVEIEDERQDERQDEKETHLLDLNIAPISDLVAAEKHFESEETCTLKLSADSNREGEERHSRFFSTSTKKFNMSTYEDDMEDPRSTEKHSYLTPFPSTDDPTSAAHKSSSGKHHKRSLRLKKSS